MDEAEQNGKDGEDDDQDGFVDEVYGWSITADKAHEINLWQRKLYCSDAKLIAELFGLQNRLARGELNPLIGPI